MATFNASGNKLTDGTNTITLSSDFSTVGGFPVTLTASASTNVTMPTTGTLSTGGLPVSEVTGTSQAMAVNTSYIASNAALVTLTLPVTAAVGAEFEVNGKGAGGWKLAQNASQSIQFTNGGSVASSTVGTGGFIASTVAADCVRLRCITANTLFEVVDSMGNISFT